MADRVAPSSSLPSASATAPISVNATHRRRGVHDIPSDALPMLETALIPRQAGDDAQSRLFLLFLYAFYGRLNGVENALAGVAPQNALAPFASSATAAASHAHLAGPDTQVNDRDDIPPPYALAINETTWSFLTDLLELRISMAMYSSNADGVNAPTTVLDEHALRALFMRAIVWYIDRECIPLTGVQVAFIGRRVGEEVNAQYPCLPITEIRDIAEQLSLDDISAVDQADFDPYMFCAGEFFPSICGYKFLLFLVALSLFISAVFGFVIARLFGTLLPTITLILGDDRIKFVMKVMFKLLDALDVFEGYVLHVSVVIFGFLEFTLHYVN